MSAIMKTEGAAVQEMFGGVISTEQGEYTEDNV